MVSAPVLDVNFESIIQHFTIDWFYLHGIYGLSNTLKIHIIVEHLGEVLKSTGKTLLQEADEHIEQAHHRVREFCEAHLYTSQNSQLGTQNQGLKQHRMVVHLNSGN